MKWTRNEQQGVFRLCENFSARSSTTADPSAIILPLLIPAGRKTGLDRLNRLLTVYDTDESRLQPFSQVAKQSYSLNLLNSGGVRVQMHLH